MLHTLDEARCWSRDAPEGIEAHVARLWRQLREFDDAITAQLALIGMDGEIGPYRIGLRHLREERHSIHQELGALLRYRKREAISLALGGRAFDGHSASLDVLSDVFASLQQFYRRVYQAVTTGISRRNVPAGMARAARISLAGAYDSSFGMIFTVETATDMAGDSWPVNSLYRTVSAFNDAGVSEDTLSLGGWAVTSYLQLVRSLNRAGALPVLEWRDPAAERHFWTPDTPTMAAVENRLAGIKETREESGEAEGVLVDAHQGKLRFELKLKRGALKGRFPEALMGKVEPLIWKSCRVRFERTIILDAGEGRERELITLRHIESA